MGYLERFPEKWVPVFRRKCDYARTTRPLRDSLQSRSGLVRSGAILAACTALLLGVQDRAQAQDLSAKPIKMIVGLAAGGATDVMARLIAQRMSESLKTTVVVENRAGGIFIPALRDLTSAPADGHTLFFISTSTLITQPLHPDYPFDLLKMTPVTQVATGPLILVARKDYPVKSVRELVDFANKNPGKPVFGAGGGTGSSLYLATELLKAKTGIKPTIVPYKGAGPALNDLLGGHIDAMFDAMPVMVVQAQAGKVTPLAVTSAKRSPALPDVPSMMEQGVDYEMAGWFGILAPPNTPPAIVKRLREEVQKAVAVPEVVAKLASEGMQPLATEPDAWRDYMKAELDRYAKIIKDAGIKPE